MKTYDALIVGAGPAGSMAAYHLAQSGLEVLILDKAQFPRQKVCGGALTQKAMNELPFDITPLIHSAVDCGYLGFRGQTVCAIRADTPIATLINRASFDAFLLEKAIGQGAVCRQRTRVTAVTQSDMRVTVHTREAHYQARFLIGADGVHSRVAQQIGFRKPHTSLSYEARLALPEDLAGHNLDTITFDFGTLWWGYGWIFPKRDHLNVGVFRNWPGKKVTRKQLLRFIARHPGLDENKILDVQAFPGPLGGSSGTFHKGRILLCGDAAGLADPWLGEGIYYALASGRMAAEAIIRQAESPHPALDAYSRQIQETFVHQFKYARRIAVLVSLFYKTNVNLLKDSPALQQMLADLLSGKQSYDQLWRSLWSSIPRLIQKLLQGK